MAEECILGTKNSEQIKALDKKIEAETTNLHKRVSRSEEGADERMTKLEDAIIGLRDRLIGRPTWTVTIIMSILLAATGASLTFAIMSVKMVVENLH